MANEGFETRIRDLLAVSGSAANVVFEECFPGRRLVGGKYHPATHTVTMYKETIRLQSLQLFGTEDYMDAYGAIVFAHELGHAEDRHLTRLAGQLDQPGLKRERKKRIALQIEQNAWHYASGLLTEWKQAALLQQIVYQSLSPYYNALKPSTKTTPHTQEQPATA